MQPDTRWADVQTKDILDRAHREMEQLAAAIARLERDKLGRHASTHEVGGGDELRFMAKPRAYNRDALPIAGNGLGSVVAHVALTAQAAAISATNLFLPPTAGCYLVSVYHVTTTAGAGGTLTTTIGWTDVKQAQTTTPAANLDLTVSGQFKQGTAYIEAETSAQLTYTTTIAGSAGSPIYALYVSVLRVA